MGLQPVIADTDRRAAAPAAAIMRDQPSNRGSEQGGFTLVELLITVAVIGILVGMLLPAISVVRSAAASTVCMSNLRQLHVGIIGYAGDWHGRTPLNFNGVPGGDTIANTNAWAETWGATVAVWLEVRIGRYPFADQREPFSDHRLGNILNCPANRKQQWQMGTHQGEEATSYGGNGWGDISMPYEAPWAQLFFGAPLRRIAHPDQLQVCWDGLYYQTEAYMNDGAGASPYTGVGARLVKYRHRGQANVLYADGHQVRSKLILGAVQIGPATVPMKASNWINGEAWWSTD